MARSEWDLAEALTGQAGTVLRQAGIEESFATPLVRAMRARMALHRGDAQAARRELVSAQHPRRLLTYALPHIAVQVRIELIRAHLALADLAGARTLMREVDDLLRRRPGLGARPGRNIGPGCQDHGAASSRGVGGHRVIGILPGMERRRALAAGTTEEEIADVLLAIAPVVGLGRVVSAAPDVATALEYDIAAAVEEPDGY